MSRWRRRSSIPGACAALDAGRPGRRAVARLRLLEVPRRGGARSGWVVLTILPVLPADLRPLVPLDGGRLAASDLHKLYGRVIARNKRLKEVLARRAPELILRNERHRPQAALARRVDRLRGLKANVLLGRLIPVGTGFRSPGVVTSARPRGSVDGVE